MRIDWKIDLGHIITFLTLFAGFSVQYGVLSARLAACESQTLKASTSIENLNGTLNVLHDTIIEVQTRMEEREKRWEIQIEAAEMREARRQVHVAGK